MSVDRLRKVADAATEGSWTWDVIGDPDGTTWEPHVHEGGWTIARFATSPAEAGRTLDQADANAEFVATFDPPTVLALLDVVEAFHELEDDDSRRQMPGHAGHVPHRQAKSGSWCERDDFEWPCPYVRGREALGRLGGDTP